MESADHDTDRAEAATGVRPVEGPRDGDGGPPAGAGQAGGAAVGDTPAGEAAAVGDASAGEEAAGGRRPPPRNPFLDIELGGKDALCLLPIFLASMWALLGQPISPKLIDNHPVLLSALRGSIPSMIASGAFASVGRASLVAALLAPLPILFFVDPFYYWAGRRYGRLLLDYYRGQSPRMDRRIGRAERFFARWGVWTIVVNPFLPIGPFLFLAAGETRMPLWKFVIADIVGNLLWIGLIVGMGWKLGQRGVDVAETIGHYGTILTIVMVVVVIVVLVRQQRGSLRSR